jgi:hypothetical protein
MGSGGIAPHILNVVVKWRRVINFTSQSLYDMGKNPQYLLDRRWEGVPETVWTR